MVVLSSNFEDQGIALGTVRRTNQVHLYFRIVYPGIERTNLPWLRMYERPLGWVFTDMIYDFVVLYVETVLRQQKIARFVHMGIFPL